MILRLGRTAIAASILAVGGGVSTAAFANPVLEFNNLFGWVEGTQSCTDRTGSLSPGGGTCDGGPNDIIVFSDPTAALGADAFGTASWRNFDEGTDGIGPDSPLSLLNAQGFASTLAPGETKVVSEFFHDNNVLSPFGEAFDWVMQLRNRFTVNVAGGGPTIVDTGNTEFTFNFVETLNFANPASCTEEFAEQLIGDRGCNDRWIGEGINVLTTPIPVGLIAPGVFDDPNALLLIGIESEGELVLDRAADATGDITVHTAEPLDSTLRFTITYVAEGTPPIFVSEPAVLPLLGGGLLLLGVAGRRRRSAP